MLVYFTPSFVDPREVNLPLVAFNPWEKQKYVKYSAWHYCTSTNHWIYFVEVRRSEMYSHYLLKTLCLGFQWVLVYFTPSFVDSREVNLPLVAFNPWGKQRYVKNSAWHYCTSILYPLSSTSIRLMDILFLLIGVTNIIYK